ncbi:hypothetical protein GCM10009767_28510 [Kocuria aegyptia]|uniref:Transposase n=1 Tax=Kocuria aegyptia TaxID=330943 RepID=A0ABN2KXE7_9MICC
MRVDSEIGEILLVATIVTDNGGPFRSSTFGAVIAAHSEPHHVRTKTWARGRSGHSNADLTP